MIHENRGLTDHLRDVARRLAKEGFVALSVDLLSRRGGTAKVPADMVQGALGALTAQEIQSDLSAALDHLATLPGVRGERYGVTGFCYGGGQTFNFAAVEKRLAAAVPHYGPPPMDVNVLKNTTAAILAHYAANDGDRVNGGIMPIEKAMKEAGKTFEYRVHAGANHAFNNDTGNNYNEVAAVAAWRDTIAWFQKHLA